MSNWSVIQQELLSYMLIYFVSNIFVALKVKMSQICGDSWQNARIHCNG